MKITKNILLPAGAGIIIRIILFITVLIPAPSVLAAVNIEISGVEGSLRDELRSSITLARQTEQEFLTPARIRSLYRRSVMEIENTLKSYGYYDAVIHENLEQEGDNWVASFRIETGEPVRIREVNLEISGEGTTDARLQEAVNTFPLKPEQQLNHESYESGKRRIETLARERGYFDAEFTQHTIYIDRADRYADIRLVFGSGPRYRFGEIIIPETVVDRIVIDRLIPFSEGDPYDANQLITLGQRLRASNYFNEVTVNPELTDISDNKVPVTVSVTPKPKNSIRMGLGFSTDTGPRLLGAWESRYFNRQGHRLGSDLKLSQKTNTLSGSYTIPDFRQRARELRLLSSLSREDLESHTSNIFTFGLQQQQQRWGWNERLSLSYQYENFEVADVSNNSNLLIPGLAYWKTISDDPIYTNNGLRMNVSARGSVKGALSNLTFLQTVIGAKYIVSIGNNGRLITRGEFGATYIPEFDELPASIRFYAGGDNSIRGFDYQTLGPKNENGDIIGGKYLAVGSVEYEHRFLEKWSAAVFSDFGNAYDDFSEDFVQSAGVGIRWRTPVG
ncbi:MAG: autotransporter assembly complex family protein, partial [Gammaproteobacteria bacterium]